MAKLQVHLVDDLLVVQAAIKRYRKKGDDLKADIEKRGGVDSGVSEDLKTVERELFLPRAYANCIRTIGDGVAWRAIPAPAAFQLSLAAHRLTPGLKLLLIHQVPRTHVTLGVKSAAIVRIVVLAETATEVAGLSNVDLSLGIHEDVNPEYRRGV